MAKAWDVLNLDPDAPLEICARRIIDTRFREMLSYREGTILGEDIEQLHSMRVSSRRLRSAMRNFRACFEPDGFAVHVARIRDTLLPRLISGQLRLPEAQAHLEDALA